MGALRRLASVVGLSGRRATRTSLLPPLALRAEETGEGLLPTITYTFRLESHSSLTLSLLRKSRGVGWAVPCTACAKKPKVPYVCTEVRAPSFCRSEVLSKQELRAFLEERLGEESDPLRAVLLAEEWLTYLEQLASKELPRLEHRERTLKQGQARILEAQKRLQQSQARLMARQRELEWRVRQKHRRSGK